MLSFDNKQKMALLRAAVLAINIAYFFALALSVNGSSEANRDNTTV